MKKLFTLLLSLSVLLPFKIGAQEVLHFDFHLNWSTGDILEFDHAGEFADNPLLPIYSVRFPIAGPAQLSALVQVVSSETVMISDLSLTADIPKSYTIGTSVEQDRGKYFGRVWILPLISTGEHTATRIIGGSLAVRVTSSGAGYTNRSGPSFKENSVLAEGIIHRVSVNTSGVYKLDYNFIKDKLKIDPSTFSPDRIGVFGNGDGRVPQWNSAPRVDDLEQCATLGSGLEDGQFNPGDYLLWYAQGPDQWTYDPESRLYNMELNNYDALNHYYIIIQGPTRNVVSSRADEANGDFVSASSLEYQRLEEEKVNLLGRYRPPGSGQEWYGDEMAVVDELDYTDKFDLTDLIPEDTLSYKVRFAARAANATRFYIKFDQHQASKEVGGVNLGDYESSFANDAFIQGVIIPEEPIQQILVRYPAADGANSRAWIDYIQLNFQKKNQYRQGTPLYIRDPRSIQGGTPIYTLDGVTQGCKIWDITNPFSPINQQFTSGNQITFSIHNTGFVPNEFICFDPAHDVLVPSYEGTVINQNIHNINQADLVIIYYEAFEEAALALADHRRNHDQMEVVAVPARQVFEEFGGGSIDPSAIRDFARMIYQRDPAFRYLLLIGDATYDYLGHTEDLPYQNFIPAFETQESLDPIRSFPSDDYYALLDDEEGDNLIGAIDIAVGRLPVSTAEEAKAVVEKIIYYDSNPATLNDWRSRVVMVADDQDSNTHLNQADGLAVLDNVRHPVHNSQKIYLDAFPQESTPGGDRYPGVNETIDLNMKKGALTVTYMGHGGQNGWSQERVLGINQAQSYDNINNMPLFITATCSFASYDEPGFTSAGEHLLLNQKGGAVALMTTVRAVYSGSNERLTKAVLKFLYEPDGPGIYPSFAEVLRRAKNENAIDTLDNNARKFTLLGDPSQRLAIPVFGIEVTEFEGKLVGNGIVDTISALEKASVSGIITDHNGAIISDFNGEIFLTLYDKVQTRKTLANDEDSSERSFNTQVKQLFKGTATVHEGNWSIEFVLPKDIDFTYGPGKIGLYAQNGVTDAEGYFTDFIIGGVSTEGLADDNPPVIKLFMNDENFIFGGITDANPDIYIQLSDDNGINVSGTSVGHDIEAVLDNDDKNSFILNDFYQASLDNYTKGEVRFPLTNLAPGLHTLRVTAWDVANNPGEAYLEFRVLGTADPVIEDLGNYPNPFSESTLFHFEHNRPGVPMDLQLQIYQISGQLVKTIKRENYVSDGYRVADLDWDGTNDRGVEVGQGLYVYRVRAVFDHNGNKEMIESDAEKLVILR
ncbi:MAG: type IX secretion system sortase PorU [Saprospiraceae bacterium]|nr:type IX secretion system sortase PorU [Saprospiraceae bacterium]